ncbi:MAG: diguanylate cyclase [Gemmatimonadaceae bacterium]
MRLKLGHKLTFAFSAAVAVLIATAFVASRNTGELLHTTELVARSQAVISALEGIQADALDAEAEAQAYLFAGDPAQRDRLRLAEEGVRRRLATLAGLAEDDVVLLAAQRRLLQSVEHRFGELAAAVNARDREGSAAAPSLVRSLRDREGATVLRVAVGEIRRREREQLRGRSLAAASSAERAGRIVSFGLLLVAVLAPLALLMVRNDLNARRVARRALRESETMFRVAADGSLDAFYVLRALRDRAGEVLDFEFVDLNARAEALLGHRRGDVLGQRLCELIPMNRTAGFFDKYRHVMESGTVLEEEFEVTGDDYRAAWIHHQVVPLKEGVAITSRDISERKRSEEALRALSLVDDLTGLYNRRGFLTLAQQQLKLARRGHRELVLLFVDMDDFKEINDTFGHNEGDIALRRAAEILKHTFRDSDIVARLGGDEFVVLATDTGAAGREIIINRLRQELLERNDGDGYPYRLSFSVGAARFDPDSSPSVEDLLAAADSMLYEQKKHKRQTTHTVS